jgi:hypothetical protein
MLVFNYENLDHFLNALGQRINNQIFFHFRDPGQNSEMDMSSETNEVILQFLGRPDNVLTALYQTKMKIAKKEDRSVILTQLESAFKSAGDIILIQGKIYEIVMSLA